MSRCRTGKKGRICVDFGFRPDPLVAVKCWVNDENLYIEKEAYGVGIEIDNTHNFISSQIPEFDRYTCRADSAEPKTISYLQRHGFPRMEGVKKWPNSIQEGIRFIRGFKSVIIGTKLQGLLTTLGYTVIRSINCRVILCQMLLMQIIMPLMQLDML